MKKILVVHAVQEEFVLPEIKGATITHVITGIGKAKATMRLTEAICKDRPDLVLNIGTAGTLKHKVGDIFVCQEFIDRDFLGANIPGVEAEVDFKSELLNIDFVQNWFSRGVQGICNTGDSFVSQAQSFLGDIVDMEVFAQAIVCKHFNLPLVSVKYVTDIIGQNSIQHWEAKLADARKDLTNWFEEMV